MSTELVTKVVDFRKERCDVKITRTTKNEIPDPPNFGWAGNPYPVQQYGREGCLALYKKYFLHRVETDQSFRSAVFNLRGKILGCFCKPLACHGDIIVEWLNNNK